jgi:hypothetical protein
VKESYAFSILNFSISILDIGCGLNLNDMLKFFGYLTRNVSIVAPSKAFINISEGNWNSLNSKSDKFAFKNAKLRRNENKFDSSTIN